MHRKQQFASTIFFVETVQAGFSTNIKIPPNHPCSTMFNPFRREVVGTQLRFKSCQSGSPKKVCTSKDSVE
eukprot:scaffold11662_cov117-Cylindrotheca_fusiformis.AAC.5